MTPKKLHPETLAIHAGRTENEANACATPIYQTASFNFDSTKDAAELFALKKAGNIYTRMGNPTTEILEKRIAAIEGGSAAVATASGMAAISLAILTLAKSGDHIISSTALYGGTETLFRHTLPKFGIEVEFVEQLDAVKLAKLIRPETRAIYFETIGNPAGEVLDFAEIAKVAKKFKIPIVVDNTFAPIFCQPIKFGANVVIHSLTKWIGGHGTSIGGILVDGGNFDWKVNPEFAKKDESYHGLRFGSLGKVAFATKARVDGLRNLGACLSPFNAWQFLLGVETLGLRIRKHSENAIALAKFLAKHPKVAWVDFVGRRGHSSHKNARKYFEDGFGSVFTFGLKKGEKAGVKFINSVELASHLANVGDAKTLVIHPASTTHSQSSKKALKAAGIRPEMIRVSVGLEHIEDIKADFAQALKKA
ncbi:O-acetylhomoserine aminocarboxypropyltransferase/cysteine synthase [Candidatus Gracilibacteria bacterium]|nr:O-acetylhomoserine aminocarboxypropyltransferase/cysteine synthase [Candidatus Gracilibacteria bacterium]MCF7856164.1 O-acetylhomoserine aminocarboxypropyltransferase/cysteine synthase [Candidatus Gracilibacteria bacterium]MCF7896630.1 O-acetylhomoserine aminocarboxypropyltransferase/cysteine synthase [Candidatus Gracilibacteria bacterium]